MAYEPLARLFHKDSSTGRFAENERLARERLLADSTFRTGVLTPSGELFLAVPRDLSILSEQVLRLERRVSKVASSLPPIARGALIRRLIADEVVSSNDMEGVHSTRRQISDALESVGRSTRTRGRETTDTRRFREMARLYLALSDRSAERPKTPADIRSIYDRVMDGEDLADNEPDGILFRKGGVEVIGRANRVLHEGLFPEAAIGEALDRMIALADSAEIPQLYSAIIAHYIFEYAHPFYDGNGRTGRYLLALYLSEPLSALTSLSLSRSIAESRGAYYRSFRTVEDRLNHGELTFFVMSMLGNVRSAQQLVVTDLEEKQRLLGAAAGRLDQLASESGLGEKELQCLLHLTHVSLFGAFDDALMSEISEHLAIGEQQTRKYLRRLEELGYVRIVRKRPLRFSLSESIAEWLGLNGGTTGM